jgi:CHAT domain-containing protein
MVQFYQSLENGQSRAEALQNMKLSLLKSGKWEHPYYWAAFIGIGDWRKLPPVSGQNIGKKK